MTDAEAAELLQRLRQERSTLDITRAQAIVAVPVNAGTHALDVGMTAEGLIAVTFTAPANDVLFPIELRAILVTVLRQALVVRAGAESTEDIVLVVCRSNDELLMRWFARVAVALLAPAAAGGAPALTTAILELAQLFERAHRAGQKAVIGLWAELAVIAAASDPALLLAAWREQAAEPFDFASAEERLEVKARASSSMTHYFSVDQLRPSTRHAWVAVVPVERQGNGASVHDLAEALRNDAVADARLLAKIDRVILECLGTGYAAAANDRFDLAAAKAGMTLYEAAAIPCVPTPMPEGVLSARLLVDLASVPEVDPAALATGASAPPALLSAWCSPAGSPVSRTLFERTTP